MFLLCDLLPIFHTIASNPRTALPWHGCITRKSNIETQTNASDFISWVYFQPHYIRRLISHPLGHTTESIRTSLLVVKPNRLFPTLVTFAQPPSRPSSVQRAHPFLRASLFPTCFTESFFNPPSTPEESSSYNSSSLFGTWSSFDLWSTQLFAKHTMLKKNLRSSVQAADQISYWFLNGFLPLPSHTEKIHEQPHNIHPFRLHFVHVKGNY